MASRVEEPSAPTPSTMAKSYLLGVFAILVFGSTLPFTTLALNDFDPWFITFARAFLAAVMAIACMLWTRKALNHSNQIMIFIAGLLLIYGFPGFMAIAMLTVPASHGGVILGFLPLSTALIARLFANERPSFRFWVLSLMGFMTVAAYALYHGSEDGNLRVEPGDFWLLLAGLSASFGYVIFGKLSRETPGWEIICRSLILNLPITLIGLVWFYTPGNFSASPISILALGYLGAFSMFLGFCAWNVALAGGGIARIGQLQLLQIFVTLGVATLLLSETVDLLTISAAVAITTVIALSRSG